MLDKFEWDGIEFQLRTAAALDSVDENVGAPEVACPGQFCFRGFGWKSASELLASPVVDHDFKAALTAAIGAKQ